MLSCIKLCAWCCAGFLPVVLCWFKRETHLKGKRSAPLTSRIEGNRILSALAREGTHPIFSRLLSVPFTAGQLLAGPYLRVKYGYFITEGMVSALLTMHGGTSVLIELIGPEGFLGLNLLFGYMQPFTVIAQVSGLAMRIDAAAFVEEFEKPGLFRNIMRQYGCMRLLMVHQSVGCNAVHSIRKRMACLLLQMADCVGTNIPVTHERVAHMLGARRATITVQADNFQRSGLITCGHKLIQIDDRKGLEKVACECYEFDRRALENVFTS